MLADTLGAECMKIIVYRYIVHLQKGFWLIRGALGKQGPTWDKTLSLILDLLCNPMSEN